jgi:hypothetical protein
LCRRDVVIGTAGEPADTAGAEPGLEAGLWTPLAPNPSASRRQRLAALEWDRTHPVRPSRDEFTRKILRLVAGLGYSSLSRQTGLSRRSVS